MPSISAGRWTSSPINWPTGDVVACSVSLTTSRVGTAQACTGSLASRMQDRRIKTGSVITTTPGRSNHNTRNRLLTCKGSSPICSISHRAPCSKSGVGSNWRIMSAGTRTRNIAVCSLTPAKAKPGRGALPTPRPTHFRPTKELGG